MTLIKAKGRQTSSVYSESEGEEVFIRAMRDGSIINTDWVMAKAIEGKVWCGQTGVMTTPDTFSPTIAAAMPDLLILVPNGTTIIPVYMSIGFEDTGTAAVVDILAVASSVYDNSSTSHATPVITNMRTDKAAGGSQCKCQAVVTSTGTDPESGNYVEFWKPVAGYCIDGFNASTAPLAAGVSFSKWTIGDVVVPPIIVGEGSLNIYCGATAGTGFITAIWVEEPTADLI